MTEDIAVEDLMTGKCLYAYAIKTMSEVDPVLVYEPQPGNVGNRLPVSNDRLALQRYIGQRLGNLLDEMIVQCGVQIEWRNSLDHSILVDINPLVKAGILREENLKRVY